MKKIYGYEYELILPKGTEKRTELYNESELDHFITRVKELSEAWYVSDLKVFKGEMDEFNINKVLNPF